MTSDTADPFPHPTLFDLDVSTPALEHVDLPRGDRLPVWSHAKARLIAEYLRLFVLVTKHGTYIDGFAGPQADDEHWTAKLVLESEPARLRHFHLCDRNRSAVARLRALRDAHPDRDVQIYGPADFNAIAPSIFDSAIIPDREATFCLLDQRTFECEWQTVQRIAAFRADSSGYKIEMFYFLGTSWLDRAFSGVKTVGGSAKVDAWWGGPSWRELKGLHHVHRAGLVAERFQRELAYRLAEPWPIYEHHAGARVMYYMIHATDHPDAPKLMARAYEAAVRPTAASSLQLDLYGDSP